MRLLDTSTLALHYFAADPPPYAILSHTWGDEEVGFQEWQAREGHPSIKAKEGFQKVRSFCRKACMVGYKWGWADTCCIDKSSSAELSESINSMFRWYRASSVCFVHLSDVSEKRIALGSEFANTRWFTRGWTLQELIAPEDVVFYNRDWIHMGTKRDHCKIISQLAGIDHENLVDFEPDNSVSMACRISWASKRQTTRPEDTAYCLMGIVGVNMPLLYGEGHNAFQRLQEEIIKVSDDHSLFAWSPLTQFSRYLPHSYRGVLAEYPRQFSSDVIHGRPTGGFHYWRTSYMMTNKGLQIKLPLVPSETSSTIYYGILDCIVRKRSIDHTSYGVGVPLVCISDDGTQFARVENRSLKTFDFSRRQTEGLIRQIYVRQHDKSIIVIPENWLYRSRDDEVASFSRIVSGQSIGEVDDPHCETIRTITVEIIVLCCLYIFHSAILNLMDRFAHTEVASTHRCMPTTTILISILVYVYLRPHFRRLPRPFGEGRGSLGPIRRFVDRRWL
ncbi:Vegetative incompatibility protein HET-E-1 [Diplodia seriata]|uniref:Vegetative incompatibility protein HET-E-1 n=1 Tax=Diplodia seriata TaxID=420778 RepID=A0A1S8BAK9_9PEZI|nr:Vegetative incompatibility protein HET-E-1 [Diplodia seriata]